MTKSQAKPAIAAVNALFSQSPDGLREIVRAVMQEMLEAEMTDALGAEKGERTSARLGYRSGYYTCTLITRVGKLELRVPQDLDGRFSTELFERYQRSEQALVSTLAEMYVQGVSTRKVKAITEELCGHAFSASAISAINQRLDESLDAFARRPLAEPFPYLILDARYEKVREGGVVVSQAVLIAIGIDWDGRRQILAVEMANRESRSSWKDFLLGLRRRGLNGVDFVVADDHAGLRSAVREVLAEAAFQRCYVHFLRNALDHLPRKADDDCLQEPRWLYDRRSIEEARQDLAAWIAKWAARYPKLVAWVEDAIEERHSGDKGLQEGARGLGIGLVDQPSDREFRGAIDRDEEIELALGGLHFGDVDVEIANRIGLKLALGRSFAFDLRQARDPMALEAAMQRRARQVRDGRLQSIETVVERQQGVPSEGDHDRLLLNGQDG
jgi:putative transposase